MNQWEPVFTSISWSFGEGRMRNLHHATLSWVYIYITYYIYCTVYPYMSDTHTTPKAHTNVHAAFKPIQKQRMWCILSYRWAHLKTYQGNVKHSKGGRLMPSLCVCLYCWWLPNTSIFTSLFNGLYSQTRGRAALSQRSCKHRQGRASFTSPYTTAPLPLCTPPPIRAAPRPSPSLPVPALGAPWADGSAVKTAAVVG